MIAESAAMSKSRMEHTGFGNGGWLSGNSSASGAANYVPWRALTRNLAEKAGNGCDDNKPGKKPGERAEAMILQRLSAA